jgi:conjugative transfer signal peptidase TraF
MTGQLRAKTNHPIQSNAGWAVSLLVLIFGSDALGLALAAAAFGVRFNDSPSMPIGLYVTTSSDSRGTLVVFCPAEPFARLSIERGYRSRGNCPDSGEPLAKPTVARPGDLVELSATGLAVNGRLLPNTAPLEKDSAGRPLSHCPFGRYFVAPGSIWVASSFNARSFDSRYFGPVAVSRVREHVRLIWTLRTVVASAAILKFLPAQNEGQNEKYSAICEFKRHGHGHQLSARAQDLKALASAQWAAVAGSICRAPPSVSALDDDSQCNCGLQVLIAKWDRS